jgi:hypothetical protein
MELGEVLPVTYRHKLQRMRDIETIDSELRPLVAIRRIVWEEEGRTRSACTSACPVGSAVQIISRT